MTHNSQYTRTESRAGCTPLLLRGSESVFRLLGCTQVSRASMLAYKHSDTATHSSLLSCREAQNPFTLHWKNITTTIRSSRPTKKCASQQNSAACTHTASLAATLFMCMTSIINMWRSSNGATPPTFTGVVGEQATIKSRHGTRRLTTTFLNHTPGTVEIFWCSWDGSPKFYNALAPGEQ